MRAPDRSPAARRRPSKADLDLGAAHAVVVVAVPLLDEPGVQPHLADAVEDLDRPADQHLLAGDQVVAEAPAVGEAGARGHRRALPVDADPPEPRAVDVLPVANRAEALVAVVAVARV